MKILTKVITFSITLIFLFIFLSSAVKTGKSINIALAYIIVISAVSMLIFKFTGHSPLKALPVILIVSLLLTALVDVRVTIVLLTLFGFSKPGRVLIHNVKVLIAGIISRVAGGKYGGLKEN